MLKSTEYQEDAHISFDMKGVDDRTGLTLVQTATKYRLHRLLPVLLGLGAPAYGGLHLSVTNGDTYATALLTQMAASKDDLNYSFPSYFGGLTALQLADNLGYQRCSAHIRQALALALEDTSSAEYIDAKALGQLPLTHEYPPQTPPSPSEMAIL